MAENGLVRGEHGLQVYMMCEIPSNVVLAEKFATRFDGFLDRLERPHPAGPGCGPRLGAAGGTVRRARRGRHGDDQRGDPQSARGPDQDRHLRPGPSNHPEFAAFLVGEGIDSISLNPDSYLRTVPRIAEAEKLAASR